jgi:hypothetical protein
MSGDIAREICAKWRKKRAEVTTGKSASRYTAGTDMVGLKMEGHHSFWELILSAPRRMAVSHLGWVKWSLFSTRFD